MKSTWQGFLKRNSHDAEARLLVAIGGPAPAETVRRIKARLRDKVIDLQSACDALDAARRYAERHGRGTLVDLRDPQDWAPCAGGYRHKRHIEVDINDQEQRMRI